MISKIIQKEKERQERFLNRMKKGHENAELYPSIHKQSLINLKEYLEERINFIEPLQLVQFDGWKELNDQLKEDIQELNKMIERYE